MDKPTYSIYSGTQQVTSILSEPLTDLEEAVRLARELSEAGTQRDATISVLSHKVEQGGLAEWWDVPAAFVNGEAIGRDDERYPEPHDLER